MTTAQTTPLLESLQAAFAAAGFSAAPDRVEAWKRLQARDLPGSREESWRFTPLKDLGQRAFRLVGERGAPAPLLEASDLRDLDAASHLVVDGTPVAGADDHPFRRGPEGGGDGPGSFIDLLNRAFHTEALEIVVPRGERWERPLWLRVLSAGDRETMQHVRIRVRVEEDASVSVVEDHFGSNGLTSMGLELDLAPGARLEWTKLGREAEEGIHLAHTRGRVAKGADLHHRSLVTGGRLVRNELEIHLEGADANCRLDGLALVDGRQLADHQLRVHHAVSHTHSQQHYRNVLDGHARAVFSGRVKVEPDAQQIDAEQNNRNLLLSGDATMNTMPQLEIYADDVKCSHGATLGQLDDTALFYLRTRGIDAETARRLLIFAFAGEVMEGIEPPALAAAVRSQLLANLPHPRLLEESA